MPKIKSVFKPAAVRTFQINSESAQNAWRIAANYETPDLRAALVRFLEKNGRTVKPSELLSRRDCLETIAWLAGTANAEELRPKKLARTSIDPNQDSTIKPSVPRRPLPIETNCYVSADSVRPLKPGDLLPKHQ